MPPPAAPSKSQASTKAVAEREALANLVNDDKTKRDTLSSSEDQLEGTRRKIERLEGEEATLQKRKETVRVLLIHSSCLMLISRARTGRDQAECAAGRPQEDAQRP